MRVEPSNSWTLDTAQEALAAARPYESWQLALKIIGGIGLVIAGALVTAAAIKLSAVILVSSGIIAITSIGLLTLGLWLKKRANHLTVDKGLTAKVRAELGAEHFKNTIETVEKFDLKAIAKMYNKIGDVSLLVSLKFWPSSTEEAQFAVDDTYLSEKKVLEILIAAYNKGIILHLKSLEKFEGDSFEKIRESLIRAGSNSETGSLSNDKLEAVARRRDVLNSFFISTKFVKQCFESGCVDVKKMNKQLNALAVKYKPHRVRDAQALKPSVSLFDENTINVYSYWGAVGNLEQYMNELDIQGATIRLTGIGFRKCYYMGVMEDVKWEAFIEKFISTHTYKTKIEDHTNTPLDNESFWQAIPPKVQHSPY